MKYKKEALLNNKYWKHLIESKIKLKIMTGYYIYYDTNELLIKNNLCVDRLI